MSLLPPHLQFHHLVGNFVRFVWNLCSWSPGPDEVEEEGETGRLTVATCCASGRQSGRRTKASALWWGWGAPRPPPHRPQGVGLQVRTPQCGRLVRGAGGSVTTLRLEGGGPGRPWMRSLSGTGPASLVLRCRRPQAVRGRTWCGQRHRGLLFIRAALSRLLCPFDPIDFC